MHFIFIAVSLFLFWLLLSGHYTALLLSLGGVSVGLVVWILVRMDRVDGEPSKIHLSFAMLGYFVWLMKEVVKANVDVVRRIWDPALPIQPHWRRLPVSLHSKVAKALYANSITLTPGTLTTDVNEDHFLVHSLTAESLHELEQGEMQRRIKDLDV